MDDVEAQVRIAVERGQDPVARMGELMSEKSAFMLVIYDDAQPYATRPGWRPEWEVATP